MKDDSSYRLSLENIDLEKKLHLLRGVITGSIKDTESNRTRTLGKLRRWLKRLDIIIEKTEEVRKELLPRLEKTLEIQIEDPELLLISMFQPSTKNIFLEMRTHYCDNGDYGIAREVFDDLISLSDMAEIIALVGDSAISMAAVHYLWQPKATNSGELTRNRAKIVSNENMSSVCDDWGLYKYRIHFDPIPPSRAEMEHDKGTLLEAIYGIIYIEQGLVEVERLIGHLA